jgi:hypothetical protein
MDKIHNNLSSTSSTQFLISPPPCIPVQTKHQCQFLIQIYRQGRPHWANPPIFWFQAGPAPSPLPSRAALPRRSSPPRQTLPRRPSPSRQKLPHRHSPPKQAQPRRPSPPDSARPHRPLRPLPGPITHPAIPDHRRHS